MWTKRSNPTLDQKRETNKLWNRLARLMAKNNVMYSSPIEEVRDVRQTNKKNGRVLTTYEALEIAIRKITRRYGKEIG